MPQSFIPKKKFQSQILIGFLLAVSVFGFSTLGSFALFGLPILLYSYWSVNLIMIISQVFAVVLCITGILRLDKEKEKGMVLGILGVIMSVAMIVLLIIMFTLIVASPSL